MTVNPGAYARKAVHQYRARDVFAYLALRYYLEADRARSDRWAEQNAAQVVLASPKGRYLPVKHLKSLARDGTPEHRSIYVPSPSEALVEALIICECAAAWKREKSPMLFSYEAQERHSDGAYFENYMPGLRRRQAAIGQACERSPQGVVRYVDIRSFYPSITPERAELAWSSFCDRHDVPELTRILGQKLIFNHSTETKGKSILTGPMISHFLANLVLNGIDESARDLPAEYFRYVDDITLVGDEKSVSASLEQLRDRLGSIGLSLHENNPVKDMSVSATEWLTSVGDFNDEDSNEAWRDLVGDIKKFLLLHPEWSSQLDDALRTQGFRFPLPSYASAVSERTTFERVRELGLWPWLLRRTSPIERIVGRASSLAHRYEGEVNELLGRVGADSPFQRKRKISKLRYRLGRLLYLSSDEVLAQLVAKTADIEELRFHTAVASAIVTGDCSEVVGLGSNVAQAAAQVFRATGETARFSRPVSTDADMQGLAVFLLNGVSVEGEIRTDRYPLVQLAALGVDRDLMTQPRGFVQEIACLHGLGEARHATVMKTAFDLAQDISLDALELECGSYM